MFLFVFFEIPMFIFTNGWRAFSKLADAVTHSYTFVNKWKKKPTGGSEGIEKREMERQRGEEKRGEREVKEGYLLFSF